MSMANKFLASTFLFLLLASFMVFSVNFATVQAVATPSVPQIINIELVDYSYDVPPSSTTTTNPYTGEEITTTSPGYRVEDLRIEVTIKNQPFTPYNNEKGETLNLYYDVRFKGHFSEGDWQVLNTVIQQLDSQYTVVTWEKSANNYATGSKLDFRAEASIRHRELWLYDPEGILPPQYKTVVDARSDWSAIQTFTIPGKPAQPSQTANPSSVPTSDPTNPSQQKPWQLYLIILGTICIITIPIIIVTYINKQRNNNPFQNQPITTA